MRFSTPELASSVHDMPGHPATSYLCTQQKCLIHLVVMASFECHFVSEWGCKCMTVEQLSTLVDACCRYAELVYNGFWFSPEREALQAAIDASQKYVSGTVRLKLYKVTTHSSASTDPVSTQDCSALPLDDLVSWPLQTC